MANAMAELIAAVGNAEVECGSVVIQHFSDDGPRAHAKFNGHAEFLAMLPRLDVEYDAEFGSQECYGTVLLVDGSWLERWEYDGSEGWRQVTRPTCAEAMGTTAGW